MPSPPDARGRPLRWALHSKHPNGLKDYSIIADSTRGQEVKELGRLIRRSLPGSPIRTDAAPARLPWVTFAGSGGYAAPERLGVAIMDWDGNESRDASGRSIAATRYFDIAFGSEDGAQPGYREMYAAVTNIGLPIEHDVQLPLPQANLGHLAEDIDSLGFDWVASLAALLLDQPVMIAAETYPPLDERVRCLDAVAALLPYGFRADLVAGTWTPNLASHEIRLAFADRVKDRQHQVGWSVVPDLTSLTGPAPQYLSHLLGLQERVGTAEVVRRLWRRTSPLSPGADGAATALRYLEQEDRPYSTVLRYRHGVATPGEARAVLTELEPADLEPEIKVELLRRLTAEATDVDLPLLDRFWSDEVLPVLAESAADAPADLVLRYTDLVARRGELVRFRIAVVRSAGDELAPEKRIRIGRLLGNSTPPSGEAELRLALYGNQVLCVDLVTAVVDGGPERFVPWLRWLTDGVAPPRWLQPFAVAVRARALLHPGDAVALASWGPPLLIAVLTVARDQQTVPAVLPGLWLELTRTVDQDQPRRAIAALLADLPAQPARTQALIDLLLAVWQEAPRRSEPVDGPEEYAAVVADQLQTWIPPQRRLAVALRLVHDLTNPAPKPAGLTLAVALVERLRPDQTYHDIARGLVPAIEAAPDTLRLLPAVLRHLLLEMSMSLRSRGLLDRLGAAVANGIDENEVIELWTEGVRLGCRSDEVLRTLRPWPDAQHPARVYAVIESLLDQLVQTGRPDAVPAVQAAHEAVLSGVLGDRMATEYRVLLQAVGHRLHLHSVAVSRALHGRADAAVPLLRHLLARRGRRR